MSRNQYFASFAIAMLLGSVLSSCATAPQRSKTSVVRRTVANLPLQRGARGVDLIAANQSVSGTLDSTDEIVGPGDTSYYDAWAFTGTAGDTVTIDMASEDVDSYLMLISALLDDIELVAEDDDSGEDVNASITAVLPGTGAYYIIASSSAPKEAGTYALRFTSKAGLPPAPAPVVSTNYVEMYPGGGDPNERYALLVGLSDYPGTEQDLLGPAYDIVRMREVLINKFGYRPENIVTLRDAQGTREGIANAFVRHLGQAGPNGSAFFYYSGHGMQLEENVAAVDTANDAESDGVDEALYIFSEQGGMSSVLIDDELGWLTEQLKTDRVLVMLDACHTGSGTRARQTNIRPREVPFRDVRPFLVLPTTFYGGKQRSVQQSQPRANTGVEELAGPSGHILLAGSTNVQVSWEVDGKGVFTSYLTAALEAADENTIWSELMARVRANVEEFTGNEPDMELQSPQLEGTRANARVYEFLGRR